MDQEALKCFFSRELKTPEAKEGFVKKLKEIVEKNGRLASSDTELAALLRDVIGYQGDPAD